MLRTLIAISLVVSPFLVTNALPQDKEISFYEVGASDFSQQFILLLRKRGSDVEAINVATGTVWKGRESDHMMEFSLTGRDGSSGTTLRLHGSIGDKKLTGEILLSGASLPVEGVGLASVWACSNHTHPTHTAKSEEGIREQTARHGCEGWHKLKPSDFD